MTKIISTKENFISLILIIAALLFGVYIGHVVTIEGDSYVERDDFYANKTTLYENLNKRALGGEWETPSATVINIAFTQVEQRNWGTFAEKYPNCEVKSTSLAYQRRIPTILVAYLRSKECPQET